MNRKFLVVMVAALALCLGGAVGAIAAGKTLVNGIDANFPPFAFVAKDGKPSGFDVEAMDWIATKMGFKVTHKPMDWDGIIPSLNAKKIDMIASGMTRTKERMKAVNFTMPYWTIQQVMVAPKDSKITVEQALKSGKSIGVQRGTTEAKWFTAQKGKNGFNYTIRQYDSAPLSVEDMLAGRVAVCAMDDAPAKDIARKKPIKLIGTYGMAAEQFAYAVRKADKKLLETLNKGLKALMASPKWEELKKKYKVK